MSHITDKERIDALERELKKDPFVLWTGRGDYPGGSLRGLGLLDDTLRERIDSAFFGITPARLIRKQASK